MQESTLNAGRLKNLLPAVACRDAAA